MKQIFIILFLIASFITDAQKKSNPDTLNFVAINKLMYPDGVTFHKINTADIYNLSFAPYNTKRQQAMSTLINELDNLNIAILDNGSFMPTRLNDYKVTIDRIKAVFPRFNIAGYEQILYAANQRENDRQEKQRIANEEQRRQHEKYLADEKQKEVDAQIARQKESYIHDSINLIELRQRDSIYAVEQKEEELRLIKRRNNLIKMYGSKNGNMIADGNVALGMTKKMCLDAWGEPNKTTITKSTSGLIEFWLYTQDFSSLTFKNGILVSRTE